MPSSIQALEIDLTSRGRLNNLFYHTKKLRQLDVQQLFDFYQRFKKELPLTKIFLRGVGEPLLHPEFSRVARFFLDQGLGLDIFTFPDQVEKYLKIFGYGNRRISFTCYCYPAADYRGLIHQLNRLREKQRFRFGSRHPVVNVSFYYLLDPRTIGRLEKFLQYFCDQQENYHVVKILSPQHFLTNAQEQKARQLMTQYHFPSNIHWLDGHNPNHTCTYLRHQRLFIRYDNQVAFCHFLSHLSPARLQAMKQFQNLQSLSRFYEQHNLDRRSAADAGADLFARLQRPSPCQYCWQIWTKANLRRKN